MTASTKKRILAKRDGDDTPRSLHRLGRRGLETICNALWLASEWEKSLCSSIPSTSKESRDRKRASRKYLALMDKIRMPSMNDGATDMRTKNLNQAKQAAIERGEVEVKPQDGSGSTVQ
jgi:hypothetical protein